MQLIGFILLGLKYATSTQVIADTRRVSSDILNMFNNSLRMPAMNVYATGTQQVRYARSMIAIGKQQVRNS